MNNKNMSRSDRGIYFTIHDGVGDVKETPEGNVSYALAGTLNTIDIRDVVSGVVEKIVVHDHGPSSAIRTNNDGTEEKKATETRMPTDYSIFPINKVKSAVMSHVHMDHQGGFLDLYAERYKRGHINMLPIYTSEISRKLMAPIGEDSLKIRISNSEERREKIEKERKKFRDMISGWNKYIEDGDTKQAEKDAADKLNILEEKIKKLGLQPESTSKNRAYKKLNKTEKKNFGRWKQEYSKLKKLKKGKILEDVKSTPRKLEDDKFEIKYLKDSKKISTENIKEWRKDELKESIDIIDSLRRAHNEMQYSLIGCETNIWNRLTDEIEVKFYNAGHSLGAVSAVYRIALPEQEDVHILITGDLGRYDRTEGLPSPEIITEKLDLVVIEGTYADTNKHISHSEAEEELKNILKDVFRHGTKDKFNRNIHWFNLLLTAVFHYQRGQDIEVIFNRAIKELKQEVQEGLVKINEEIEKNEDQSKAKELHRELRNLKTTEANMIQGQFIILGNTIQKIREIFIEEGGGYYSELKDSIFTLLDQEFGKDFIDKIGKGKYPEAVIAPGGMLQKKSTANRVHHKIKENMKAITLFVGYQANGTPGHAIQNEEDAEETIECAIESISLSGHASRSDLLRYIQQLHLTQESEIIITHADLGTTAVFEKEIYKLANVKKAEAKVRTGQIGEEVRITPASTRSFDA